MRGRPETHDGQHPVRNHALHAIKDANLRRKGVFQDVDLNHKERFPDTVLEALIQHFDKDRLREEFCTPKMVVRQIREMLEGLSIHDLVCASDLTRRRP